MKNFVLIIVLAALSPLRVSAQQTQTAPQQETVKITEDFDGTFQVMYKTWQREIFPKNFREIVEQHRHQTDMVLFEYSDFTTVRIFPKDIINDPNFIPITEIFIFLSGGK